MTDKERKEKLFYFKVRALLLKGLPSNEEYYTRLKIAQKAVSDLLEKFEKNNKENS